MTIAVHINAGKHESLSDNFSFICFSELAAAQPESHFIFIFDTPPHPELYLEPNCTPVILLPSLKNNLVRHYWYNYKLPAILQRYNAGSFLTAGVTCSLRIKIPQYLVVHARDISLPQKSIYLKRYMTAFFQKAAHIFTTDRNTFETLQNKYGLHTKTTLLYPGLKIQDQQASYEEREATKNEFSGGHEYFLYPFVNHDFEKLKIVLKAFSIFKKWQKSSMRLVLLTNFEFDQSIAKELNLYKYRNDLVVCKTAGNKEQLIQSTYAILLDSPHIFETALPAMKSGVPVIINENFYSKKTLQGAIHTTWQEKNISEKMMLLYKDEHLRRDVSNHGLETTAKYSWRDTSEKIWQSILNMTNS